MVDDAPATERGGDARRAEIVRAAAMLFAASGYASTSMDALAKHLEVSKPVLYYHAGSKEEIVVELFLNVYRRLGQALDLAISASTDVREQLRGLVSGHVRVVVHDLRPLAGVDLRDEAFAAHRDAVERAIDDYAGGWRALLERGIAAGAFRPDTAPELMAPMFITMCSSVAWWYRPDGPLSLREIADHVARMLLDGIGTSAS